MNDLQTLQGEINIALENTTNPVAVILEGRDGAGKTGAIRQATEYLPFSQYKIIHSRKPNTSAMNNWLPYWHHQLLSTWYFHQSDSNQQGLQVWSSTRVFKSGHQLGSTTEIFTRVIN